MNTYSDHIATTSARDTYIDERLHTGFRDILGDIAPGTSVLEVACGSGTLLQALRTQGSTVSGFDLSPGAVDMCRAKGLDVVQGNADQFDTDPVLIDLFSRGTECLVFSKCLMYLARKSDIFSSFKGKTIYVYQSNPDYWKRRLSGEKQNVAVDEFRFRTAAGNTIAVNSVRSLRRWGEEFGYRSRVVTDWSFAKKNIVIRFDRAGS